MQGESSTQGFAEECHAIRTRAGDAVRSRVGNLVARHAHAFAGIFYSEMFSDPQAAALLDHAVVNARLRASMAGWLTQLFDDKADPVVLAQAQRSTGEVHARIGVPALLVSRGARVLTRAIVEKLGDQAPQRDDVVQAAQYVYEMFSLAVDHMAAAYSLNSNRLARSDEAFRLFFLGQDMKAERERRRSELLEWAQQILERYYWSDAIDQRTPGQPSAFSLWLDHKASILFQDAPEVALIRTAIERVEQQLLPQLSGVRHSHDDARAVVGEIHGCIDQIKSLIGNLFDRYLAVEDGRDSVTALLNRRYFPAIAKREIEIALARHVPFSVLMVGIDRFSALVATWGIERGEQLLARVAHLMQEHVRAGDFVFRIGDDVFLLLLVEADRSAAQRVADGLRKRVEASPIRLSGESAAGITLSVGGAVFDEHPDYQRLLDRADAALRRAQAAGPSRCEFED